MAKQYKPGQFIWIGGKQHRVTKAPSMFACEHCRYKKSNVFRSSKMYTCTDSTRSICVFFLPADCYPKPINYG